MEPQPPAGMGFAVRGQPIWMPALGSQADAYVHLAPPGYMPRAEPEQQHMQLPMGVAMVHARSEPQFDGYQLPDGHYVVHAQPPDGGHLLPPPLDPYAQALAHGRAMALAPQRAAREEAAARCKRLLDVLSAKEGAPLLGDSPAPGVAGLGEMAARLGGWAQPYAQLPGDFVADMRRLWVTQRAAHGEGSNLGQLARLMHAAFERLSREWVTGDVEGRPPIPLGYVLRAHDDMCSGCGTDGQPERMALCEACDRRVHIDCMRPPRAEMPDVSAHAARDARRARAARAARRPADPPTR